MVGLHDPEGLFQSRCFCDNRTISCDTGDGYIPKDTKYFCSLCGKVTFTPLNENEFC